MELASTWISGSVRSGKTTALIECLADWSRQQAYSQSDKQGQEIRFGDRTEILRPSLGGSTALVFALNSSNRQGLMPALGQATAGLGGVQSTTPLGFFEDEVLLFWPRLMQGLDLPAQFPVRLRPETEQQLASQFWQAAPWDRLMALENLSLEGWVRRILDLLQLAAFAGIALEALPQRLEQGFEQLQIQVSGSQGEGHSLAETLVELLVDWRDWCLQHGLVTYGIVTELFWRYLLPDPVYQGHLLRRYQGVFVDDLDSYPAISRPLFEVWLDHDAIAVFTFNPEGAIRLGLGADPDYLADLRLRCSGQRQASAAPPSLGHDLRGEIESFIQGKTLALGNSFLCLQTSSRSQLLRQTGNTIIEAIQSGQIAPQEIAIIGPGLDSLARYTLIEILTAQGIPVESLKDQRPLNSTAIIRALLTLLALVYPGLGQFLDAEQIAEMLVVLTYKGSAAHPLELDQGWIDPVRAGLLADYCFQPDRDHPQLLPTTTFPRWDRLGHQATAAYNNLLQWLGQQREACQGEALSQPYLSLTPVFILDRAIQYFLTPHRLTYDQLAVLRELMETAQHYWQIKERLRQTQTQSSTIPETVGHFIQLLRQGTLTANPFPVNLNGQPRRAVMLATTFQYRIARPKHRWHFWLDAGSMLWHGGGAVMLWGAPLCLQQWSGQPLTLADQMQRDQAQLQRLLLDLLSRVTERVILCQSHLSVSGQEQIGPLLPLVDSAPPLPLQTEAD
ncbi:MAG: recombinase family protein [Acaryochloridaceae cyanobacterium SU_2_1]|nr:recombinase family protein [Acaryochloridaceae cyanobacterium SU_2_1]